MTGMKMTGETKKALAALIGTVAVGPVSALGSGLYRGYTGEQQTNTLDAIAMGHGAIMGGLIAFGPGSDRTPVVEGFGSIGFLAVAYSIAYGLGLGLGTAAKYTLG